MSVVMICEQCDKVTLHSVQPHNLLRCDVCGVFTDYELDSLELGQTLDTSATDGQVLTVRNGEELVAAVLNEVRDEMLTMWTERIKALELRVSSLFDRVSELRDKLARL